MNPLVQATRTWVREAADAWDRFWFTPAPPQTFAAIRVLAGAMLFYTHLVWSLELKAFLGPHAFINNETARKVLQADWYSWSYLWYIDSPALLWTVHFAALVVFALLTLGLFTRVVSVLACLITLAYCHRLHGALFGLDQINAMLATYLMLAPCGEVYSLDSWLRSRRAGKPLEPRSFVSTNVAIRLIQLHMCVIYLFGGISKLRGQMWWDGSAVWGAIANLEYQSIDLTWLAHVPWLIALMTHVTIFWETFYCFTIWPKWSRPLTLALAVGVHGGIALGLGMITFGLAMIIANLAFVAPSLVGATVSLVTGRRTARAGAAAIVSTPSATTARIAARA